MRIIFNATFIFYQFVYNPVFLEYNILEWRLSSHNKKQRIRLWRKSKKLFAWVRIKIRDLQVSQLFITLFCISTDRRSRSPRRRRTPSPKRRSRSRKREESRRRSRSRGRKRSPSRDRDRKKSRSRERRRSKSRFVDM